MKQPITEKEFTERLQSIQARFNAEVVALVHETQVSHGLDISTDESLPFADSPNIEHFVDSISCLGGWVADRLKGINRLHKKSLTKKIRKALGYTYP